MMLGSDVERQEPRRVRAWWAAYAACAWAVIFAGLSFFWAAGGRTGLQPLEQAGGSNGGLLIAANVVAGALKLGLGLLAFALVGA